MAMFADMKAPLLAVTTALLVSCGVSQSKIPGHMLYADEEDQLTHDGGELSFAVVGNLESEEQVTKDLVGELRRRVDKKELDFVLLTGDAVPMSSTKTWQAFDKLWREVLDGESIPTTEGYRVPVVAVTGDREYVGDKKLLGMEGSFPGYGTDIGYNRVASWFHFDVRVDDAIWRFLVVDTNKDKLGSRWNEQMYWIPRATEGRYDKILVFMHHPPLTLAKDTDSNNAGAPLELLEAIEDGSGLMKVKAVFSGQPKTTEVMLPDGKLGTAFFTAGGGGADAEELERWGNASAQGYGDIMLDPFFDLKLQGDFEKEARAGEWPEQVIDKAKASGTWEGFTAAYDPKYFPLYGYWMVTISGDDLAASYRMYDGGDFDEVYRIDFEGREWKSGG